MAWATALQNAGGRSFPRMASLKLDVGYILNDSVFNNHESFNQSIRSDDLPLTSRYGAKASIPAFPKWPVK